MCCTVQKKCYSIVSWMLEVPVMMKDDNDMLKMMLLGVVWWREGGEKEEEKDCDNDDHDHHDDDIWLWLWSSRYLYGLDCLKHLWREKISVGSSVGSCLYHLERCISVVMKDWASSNLYLDTELKDGGRSRPNGHYRKTCTFKL